MGRDGTAATDQYKGREEADASAVRHGLLDEHQECYRDHGGNVHDAERDEDEEQHPAAAHAVEAMRQAHADRTAASIAPPGHHERKRGAAVTQADVLQGRELVEPGE